MQLAGKPDRFGAVVNMGRKVASSRVWWWSSFFSTSGRFPSNASRHCWLKTCLSLLLIPAMPLPGDQKLTFDERVELMRGLMAEYATAKTFLPRSKKSLQVETNGTF